MARGRRKATSIRAWLNQLLSTLPKGSRPKIRLPRQWRDEHGKFLPREAIEASLLEQVQASLGIGSYTDEVKHDLVEATYNLFGEIATAPAVAEYSIKTGPKSKMWFHTYAVTIEESVLPEDIAVLFAEWYPILRRYYARSLTLLGFRTSTYISTALLSERSESNWYNLDYRTTFRKAFEGVQDALDRIFDLSLDHIDRPSSLSESVDGFSVTLSVPGQDLNTSRRKRKPRRKKKR